MRDESSEVSMFDRLEVKVGDYGTLSKVIEALGLERSVLA
jgi:hypothetical protein